MQVPDLKDQIRTYYESTTEPIDIDGFVDALLGQESEGAEVIVGPFGTRTRSPMPDQSPTPWYRSLIGIAAAILTAVAIGVIALTVASGPDDEVADEPTTVTAPSTTVAAAEFGEADALAVVEEYFAAFERGDIETIDALIAPDATVAITGTSGRDEYVRLDAWDIGQGGQRVNRECTPEGSTVLCSYDDLQGIAAIVGAPPTHWDVTVAVSPDGAITDLQGSTPGFLYDRVNDPFKRWMQQNHPELVNPTDCCGGDTVEAALANGALRLEYGQLWAAYLAENGCTLGEPCVNPEFALQVAAEFLDLLLAGDGEPLRDYFTTGVTPGTRTYGNTGAEDLFEDVSTHHAWNQAQGVTISKGQCRIERQTANGVLVACDYSPQQHLRELIGADSLNRTMFVTVTATGHLATFGEAVFAPEPYRVDGLFQSWIRANHPEVESLTGCCRWEGVEEATLAGLTRREYAELWAAYLEENGCTWDQPCEP